MRNGIGLFVIIFALFAIWAYNSGRAQAFLTVLKTPPGVPATLSSAAPISSTATSNVASTGNTGIGGVLSGLVNPIESIAGIFGLG